MEGIQELQQAVSGRTSQSNDVCHYTLYFPPPQASTSKLANSIESLQATTAAILEYTTQLCDSAAPDGSYIWQREPFRLRPSNEALPSGLAGAFCLQGSTCVGESVEDEWWIVWLLQQISLKWTDAVIEIHDSDGQFLLIEAAEALPGWLNPDNADNRVWINAGNLHLIPLDASRERDGHLGLATALSTMFDASRRRSTIVSENISKIVWSRTSGVREAVKTEHSHRTIAYLPDEIIRLLDYDPSLITHAVTTFYERDAAQLKACQYMRRFRPTPAHYATVRMTRALYAQLASQRFYPPKPFERAGWLTVKENEDPASMQSIESRRRDIGVKIACGFEMLYQEEKSSMARQRRTDEVNAPKDDSNAQRSQDKASASSQHGSSRHLSQNQAYLRYLVALTDTGYFQGESAGSTLYNRLEARAKKFWEDMQDDRAAQGRNLAERMDDLLEGASKDGIAAPQTLAEDPDTWLYIDEARLEEMLKGKPERVEGAMETGGVPTGSLTQEEREERLAQEQARRLQGMADKFSSFIDGEGDVEGAMFEDEASSDGEDDTDTDAEDNIVAGPNMPADEKQRRLDKLVPALADGEWGTAAANATRLAAKRKEDADHAVQNTHTANYDGTVGLKGPTKADMQSAGLTPLSKHDGDDSGDELFEEEKTAEQQNAASEPRLLSAATLEELSDEEDAYPDFGDGEQDDFLKFAREALGLTEEQYADILRSREKRGAYVPDSQRRQVDATELPHKNENVSKETTSKVNGSEKTTSKEKTISNRQTEDAQRAGRQAASATPKQPNSRLDSFEALMTAMDNELSKARQSSQSAVKEPQQGSASAGSMTIDDAAGSESEDEDFNMEELDAELAAALKRDEGDSAPTDYTLIKNFLESFKSQNGLAGPVSNIFGRLDKDFSMPRDK